jgi:uncharacterized protein
MELESCFSGRTVVVWPGTFVVARAREIDDRAFANIADGGEFTVIVEQNSCCDHGFLEIEKGFKLLTFDLVLPFGLVGFLARILGALAESHVSVFVLSAYHTDHILVKETDLGAALDTLSRLGFVSSLGFGVDA